MAVGPPIRLPRHWSLHVKSGVLHAAFEFALKGPNALGILLRSPPRLGRLLAEGLMDRLAPLLELARV